jgi:hypothetical protein
MYRRDDNESALTQRPMAKLKSELETKDKELQVRAVEQTDNVTTQGTQGAVYICGTSLY